jgi:hypothetical protein
VKIFEGWKDDYGWKGLKEAPSITLQSTIDGIGWELR